MDWAKYPLEKLLYFIAGIIPGSVAILIYVTARPEIMHRFFSWEYIGYRTHLALLLFVAFLVGHSLTSLCNKVLGALGGMVGYLIGRLNEPKFGYMFSVAPWRDTRWRFAAINYLGTAAPPNTQLMSRELADIRQSGINLLVEPERSIQTNNLILEKIKSVDEDRQWQEWYQQFHNTVITPDDNDVFWQVHNGLHSNIQTAAIYTLCAFYFVPGIRHWWSIGLVVMWLLLIALEIWSSIYKLKDLWATLTQQIDFLMANRRQ
jgi:hypothetical protein